RGHRAACGLHREKIKAFLDVSQSLPRCSEAPGVLGGSSVYPLIKDQNIKDGLPQRVQSGLRPAPRKESVFLKAP
ncbi:hypothetical protein, partial [Oleiphilus sp. HI0132]|uniref:hypothetical protein n=1 Tax=Oleiphilus sp. HI0132 TaxID=1822270 RepID=UPI001E3BEB50